ncbi:MAG: hypothetical protein ABI867_18160 [Kofleriaceae bacterium]
MDLLRAAELRVVGSAALELGGADSPTYIVRGLAGIAHITTRGTRVLLSAGLGATRFGDDVPASYEVPIELRVAIPARSLRIHAWTHVTFAFDPSASEREHNSAHETTFVSASVSPIGSRRMFFGTAIENRSIGADAMVLAGIPILGSY